MTTAAPSRLRQAALRHDLFAAVNRFNLHGDAVEIALLTAEQLALYRALAGDAAADHLVRHLVPRPSTHD